MTTPANAAVPQAEQSLRDTVLSRGYLRLLLLCVLLGVPVALACFFFVGLQHQLQHWVWETLPEALGHDEAPWWWPLPALVVAGLVLAPVVTRMPGAGGHLPVDGLGGAPVGPRALPGTVLAALATLPLGVVLGPEAPLMAVGSGLALLAVRRVPGVEARTRAVLATAGSTAAISTILGGPVAAAVLLIEGAGLGGARLVALLLPCLLASATGALVFTGFGDWTGLRIGALTLHDLPPPANPDAGDFLWGVPLAALIAVLVTLGRELGRSTVGWTRRDRTALRTVVCATAVGVCVAAYALITGRSPPRRPCPARPRWPSWRRTRTPGRWARWSRWSPARGWPGGSRWGACAAARSSPRCCSARRRPWRARDCPVSARPRRSPSASPRRRPR